MHSELKSPAPAAVQPQGAGLLPAWRAILFKEWVKLRVPWLVMLALSTGYALYLGLRVRRLFVLHDAVNIWTTWMGKNYLFWAPYAAVPVVFGVVLGIWQFLPEQVQQRIRLSLHLPLGEDRVICLHVLSGLLALILLWLPAVVIFILFARHYFPAEIGGHLFWTLAPPLLAGCAGYLLTVAVHLEPGWRMRFVLLLVGGGALPLFFLAGFHDHYSRVLWGVGLWTLGLMLLPVVASRRFRAGGQQ